MIVTWLNCIINWIFSILRKNTIYKSIFIDCYIHWKICDINNEIMSNNDITNNI